VAISCQWCDSTQTRLQVPPDLNRLVPKSSRYAVFGARKCAYSPAAFRSETSVRNYEIAPYCLSFHTYKKSASLAVTTLRLPL
jgi:hypothetical protein